LITQGKTKVYHYWKQEIDRNKWRIWNTLSPQNRVETATTVKEVEEELGRRKIAVMEGNEQLRWGQKYGREFNLKEFRHYISGPGPKKTRCNNGISFGTIPSGQK
jgi:hypothetical protein